MFMWPFGAPITLCGSSDTERGVTTGEQVQGKMRNGFMFVYTPHNTKNKEPARKHQPCSIIQLLIIWPFLYIGGSFASVSLQ